MTNLSEDEMLTRIANLVNKVSGPYHNDPFMTLCTLNRTLQYDARLDVKSKYGTVKACYSSTKRDPSAILYLRTPDSCFSVEEPAPVQTRVRTQQLPPLSWQQEVTGTPSSAARPKLFNCLDQFAVTKKLTGGYSDHTSVSSPPVITDHQEGRKKKP